MMANPASSVDAPIARLFAFVSQWRRATDQRRYCVIKNSQILLLLLLFAANGCDRTTEDQTKGASAVCEVHHSRMVKTKVPVVYGLIPLTDHSRARQAASTNTFPHAQEFVVGARFRGSTAKESVIYVCPDCQKALQQWEASREVQKSGR
jgi:hypothetical protein